MLKPTGEAGTTLILGGARSGKSGFAERLVLESGLVPVYVATGRVLDEEMGDRIAKHRQQRGEAWKTVEEPEDLETALDHETRPDRAVLVDCLTLWITNLMMNDADILARSASLCGTLSRVKGPVVLVSNEVGMGIVPENRMARDFRDHAGRLHQQIAAIAAQVYFVAAGLPLKMKG
ncbi:bifunctional adenosylcobinamide kinase/adenosylcobinamide-phosphate guanylyltransferase [Oricola sp.]|uniref:bifunctional adenosylcobinamide kinase/adenosylcobinamide-phosphate guanylyltransferase n=1 Tax=Oricola sp. TaxID=1979950 RepID=UPI003BACCF65